jgi:3',5'-cyclic AMP phosphodiesterase CpdA
LSTLSFRLAHLSDAHIGPLPQPLRRELIGKRLTGYLNWQRRDKLHSMELLGQLVADIHAHKPNHIAMTGDILNIGLPAEFPLARSWLETLGHHDDVSFVPGNHDAYVRSTLTHLSRTFAPWTSNDADGKSTYPYLRIREGVALIGLSSGVPTPPFIASGKLGTAQIAACEVLLKQCGAEGLTRVIMIHHPPMLEGSRPGRSLVDARAFEAMILRSGAELILHGHNHKMQITHIAGRDGPVPIAGVASASAMGGTRGHRAAWLMFELNGKHITAHARGLMPGTSHIGDLGPVSLSPR